MGEGIDAVGRDNERTSTSWSSSSKPASSPAPPGISAVTQYSLSSPMPSRPSAGRLTDTRRNV